MGFYETNSRAGPDRMLHLQVPSELANMELHITIEPVKGANGRNGANGAALTPNSEERRRHLDRILGAIDDPTFDRPPQGEFERRESLD